MPITLIFGKVEYLDDDVIKVPVEISEPIVSLARSDWRFRDIQVLDSYVIGEMKEWYLFVVPHPETSGVMKLDVIGKVFPMTVGGLGDREIIESPVANINYNTIEPLVVARSSPSIIKAGVQSAYFDINREIVGLTTQGLELTGHNIGNIKLYAAPTQDFPVGQRPLPNKYTEYLNSDNPRRFFRVDYEFNYPAPIGNISIDLLDDAAIGYNNPLVIIEDYIPPQRQQTRQLRALPQRQQRDPVIPSVATQDATFYLNENFDVQRVLSNTEDLIDVFVDGLLRGWRYRWDKEELHVEGDAADVKSIEEGVWDIVLKYEVGRRATTSTFSETSSDSGQNFGNRGLNFGNDLGEHIQRITANNEVIYRIDPEFTGITSLRIQASSTTGFALSSQQVQCRYSATPPPHVGLLPTHGTQLWTTNTRNNQFSGDGTITNPDNGLYFWVISGSGYFPRAKSMTISGSRREEEILSEEVAAKMNWKITEHMPEITNPGLVTFELGKNPNLFIPISNSPAGIVVKGLLAGLKFEIVSGQDELTDTEITTGIRIIGAPTRLLTEEDSRLIEISASTEGGTDSISFPFSIIPAQPSAPSVARNLMAVGGNRRVELTWEAPENFGNPPVVVYDVYRGTTRVAQDLEGTTYLDTGLGAGATYSYTVIAKNATGSAPASESASATTQRAAITTRRPSAARSLSGTAGDERVSLSWQAPSDLGNPARVSYDVYRDNTRITTITTTAYTDTGRTNGTEYQYFVIAKNSAGSAPRSNIVRITPAEGGRVPSVARSVTLNPGDGQVVVSWQAPADLGNPPNVSYGIWRRALDTETQFTRIRIQTQTSYTDTNVTNGTRYQYSIQAFNPTGAASFTAGRTTTPTSATATVPGQPTNLSHGASYVRGQLRFVDVSFTTPNNGGAAITQIRVDYFDPPTRTTRNSSQTFNFANPFPVVVRSGDNFDIRIAMINSVGQSEFSNRLRITVP